MKIHSFSITSNSTLDFEIESCASVCVLCGHYSDLALDLLRELIGDDGAMKDPDRFDDGRFVLHADVEMDGKEYAVCYIRNVDFMGDRRLAVNFEKSGTSFSEDDTLSYMEQRSVRAVDHSNVLKGSVEILPSGDDRPIFIYDYFDRLDEAEEITPVLDALSALDRQVFIAVCLGYPLEKMHHSKVQIVKTAAGKAEGNGA